MTAEEIEKQAAEWTRQVLPRLRDVAAERGPFSYTNEGLRSELDAFENFTKARAGRRPSRGFNFESVPPAWQARLHEAAATGDHAAVTKAVSDCWARARIVRVTPKMVHETLLDVAKAEEERRAERQKVKAARAFQKSALEQQKRERQAAARQALAKAAAEYRARVHALSERLAVVEKGLGLTDSPPLVKADVTPEVPSAVAVLLAKAAAATDPDLARGYYELADKLRKGAPDAKCRSCSGHGTIKVKGRQVPCWRCSPDEEQQDGDQADDE